MKLSPEHYAAIQEGKRLHGAAYSDQLTRFWTHVDRSGGPNACWPWRNSKAAAQRDPEQAYAHVYWNAKYQLAHRVMVREIEGIEIPAGMVVDHICKVRYCVNPRHLRVVTRRFNGLDHSDSPHAKNAAKTHCKRGHPFTPENIAICPEAKRHLTRHGNPRIKPHIPGPTRVCLTCFPNRWIYAVIERGPPGRSKRKWRGPYKPEFHK